jgi:hypothetical protein
MDSKRAGQGFAMSAGVAVDMLAALKQLSQPLSQPYDCLRISYRRRLGAA